MLHIRLLGEFVIEVEGEAVPTPTSRRARALLGWLALNPGLHWRAGIASRLWPNTPAASARASLRTELWTLRRALGRAPRQLVATRERVGLAEGPGVWVDAVAFTELVEAGQLEEALDLSRGELLGGLDDEWVQDTREEHRRRVSDVLGRLAVVAEARGDHVEAIAWNRRLVERDPLSEEAHRELARRLAATGDRAAALAAYARLRDRLEATLGVAPSPATRRLIDGLRVDGDRNGDAARPGAAAGEGAESEAGCRSGTEAAAEPAPETRVALPPRLPPTERVPPFVGRTTQLGCLRETWRQTRSSSAARLVLVAGEPGIGKTRLATEFALEAHEHGAVVLYGRAEEEAFFPYQPFVEAIRHYVVSSPADELRRRVVPGAGALARIVPDLARRLPDLSNGPEAPGMERYLLFEAVASFLSEVSRVAPVLLLLDDLHWADKPTVMLLKHLASHRGDARVLILGMYCEPELRGSRPLSEALADIRRDQPQERLELPALEEPDVASLIAWAGRPPTAELTRALQARTQGNPFFVGELLRHLDEQPAGGGDSAERAVRRIGVPGGVQDMVERRLARLSEPCRRTLTIAAVMSREFELAALERIGDLGEDRLVDVLEEAVRAGVVTEVDGGADVYSFSHALVRESLYEEVSAARRRRLHRRTGEALEQLHADDLAPRLAELSHHFGAAAKAGGLEKAIDYAIRAGDRATAQGVYQQAVTLYGRALELLGEGNDARRRPLVVKQALGYQALMHLAVDTGQSPGWRPQIAAVQGSPV